MTSAAATDTVPAAKTIRADSGTETTAARPRRSRNSSDQESNGTTRYFLAKANGTDGTPALDREVAGEGEALVDPNLIKHINDLQEQLVVERKKNQQLKGA